MQSRDLADDEYKLARLVASLRSGGTVSDITFDAALYPPDLRRRSASFWTPVDVARRVVELLAPAPLTRVLDIGSGVGKLCIIGAAMSRALFFGVEQRARLVNVATDAASRARLGNVRFVHRDFRGVDVAAFDALYLYNPFEESAWPADEWLDATVPMSFAKARDDVFRMEAMLAFARPGTRVVTYHGFGGDMPSSYTRLLGEPHHRGHLELWVKTS